MAFVLASVNAGEYKKNRTWLSVEIARSCLSDSFLFNRLHHMERGQNVGNRLRSNALRSLQVNYTYGLLIRWKDSPNQNWFLIIDCFCISFISESESRFWQRSPSSSIRLVNQTRMTSQTRTNHQRVSKFLANGSAILWRYRAVCWVFQPAAAIHVQPAAKAETTQYSKTIYSMYIYSLRISFTRESKSQSVIFQAFQTFFFSVFLVFIDDQGRMKSASAC